MAMPEVHMLESHIVGFGFRPTDEELLNHYLKGKINGSIEADIAVIPEVHLCNYEPWDLPEKSIINSGDLVWFFFVPKDLKHPNSERSNRATKAGYWKSTGNDRVIKTRAPSPKAIGMKKTLVFLRGRAPKGKNTGWTIHEYRTVEPEFDHGGFVLCRLFKKPEENILISDKIDGRITVQGDDAFYEITPLHQEILPPNRPETVDELMTKWEETHNYSDITANIGASGICMDNLKDDPGPSNLSSLNLGCEQNDSYLSYYDFPSSYLHFDDNGVGASLEDQDDDIAKFLDDALVSDEECLECLPQFNEFLENTTEAVPSNQVSPIKPETLLDNTSGIDIIIGDNADAEVLLPQDVPGLAASYQMSGPISPSSYFTSNSYDVLGPQFDAFMKSVDFNCPENSTANELQPMNSFNGNVMSEGSDASETLFRVSDLSQELFKNEPNPSGADNSIGIGIKLRPPKKRTSADLNLGSQGMVAHGKVFRRIRLQTSLCIGSTMITKWNSSSSNGDHDMKAEISESGNHAEFEIPKMAYFGHSDNDDNALPLHAEDAAWPTEKKHTSSNNSQTLDPICRLRIKEPNELCAKPEGTLKEAPKAASINFGSVTVVLPVILCVSCIGIGWFFSYR